MNSCASVSYTHLDVYKRQVIDKNNETVHNTLALISDQYEPAALALREANIITMFGNGDAIIPCQLIGMKFMKVGKACVVLNDQDMQMFCASSIRSGDVALAVSHTCLLYTSRCV